MIWCLLIPFGITEADRDNNTLAGQIVSVWISGLCVFVLNAMLLVIDEGAYFVDRMRGSLTYLSHLPATRSGQPTGGSLPLHTAV